MDYGGVDEVAFQMYGYGGFGYNTSSRVKPDQKESIIVTAARQNHLNAIVQVLEREKDDTKRRILLNGAKRWTEVDYKMSGFTNEYEWFDLTPLATAARQGHAEIVEYLLKQGADPTLEGCPTDNEYYNASRAAADKLKRLSKDMDTLLSLKQQDDIERLYNRFSINVLVKKSNTEQECAQNLLDKKEHYRLCLEMLEAVEPFWNKAPYAGSRYSLDREKSGYSNLPTDMRALVAAVTSAKEQYEQSRKDETMKESLAAKIALYRAKEEECHKKYNPGRY